MSEFRLCAEPGCERLFRPTSSRNRFCLVHRKRGPRDPAHYRKYGPAHRLLRAQFSSAVASGAVECARCGEKIDPRAKWDLGHVDGTLAYAGPEHAVCNRATKSHALGRNGAGPRPARLEQPVPPDGPPDEPIQDPAEFRWGPENDRGQRPRWSRKW